jgi:hypothetical protein
MKVATVINQSVVVYFKEKRDGFDVFTVNQVMQRALAIES